jgi:hypothetical protein
VTNVIVIDVCGSNVHYFVLLIPNYPGKKEVLKRHLIFKSEAANKVDFYFFKLVDFGF